MGKNYKLKRIGETNMAMNGQMMTIINYDGYYDVTIQFEDGTIVENKAYDNFCRGLIRNPNYQGKTVISLNEFVIEYYLGKYNFKKTKLCELDLNIANIEVDSNPKSYSRMEFDYYNSDLKIAIEYDGIGHRNKMMLKSDFIKNKICEQNEITLFRLRSKRCPIMNNSAIIFPVGENILCHEIEIALKQIIKYINDISNLNINNNFSIKQDADKIKHSYINTYKKIRVGEEKIARNGLCMKIIQYKNSRDIDIEFEDGIIVKHKKYGDFKKGNIGHPSINLRRKNKNVL